MYELYHRDAILAVASSTMMSQKRTIGPRLSGAPDFQIQSARRALVALWSPGGLN